MGATIALRVWIRWRTEDDAATTMPTSAEGTLSPQLMTWRRLRFAPFLHGNKKWLVLECDQQTRYAPHHIVTQSPQTGESSMTSEITFMENDNSTSGIFLESASLIRYSTAFTRELLGRVTAFARV